MPIIFTTMIVFHIHVSKFVIDLSRCIMSDFSATLKIAYIAWCYTSIISTLPFVIMWIVNMGFDASGAPAECGMTQGAKHLITPLYFVDPGGAFGTRFGIFVE